MEVSSTPSVQRTRKPAHQTWVSVLGFRIGNCWRNARSQSIASSYRLSALLRGFFFFRIFFRMLAQSNTPNIYTPTPIPLLYNLFTIVLHKRLSTYMFRAAHTPACWIGTKRNKDFHKYESKEIHDGRHNRIKLRWYPLITGQSINDNGSRMQPLLALEHDNKSHRSPHWFPFKFWIALKLLN